MGPKERLSPPTIQKEMLEIAAAAAAHQKHYVDLISAYADCIRSYLESRNEIHKVETGHKAAWKDVAGKGVVYVDGGMGMMESNAFVPLAIRVGSYYAKPGTKLRKFAYEKQQVNQLVGDSDISFYDETDHNIAELGSEHELMGAARITVEAAGLEQSIDRYKGDGLAFAFLHGSLVNPVTRYTAQGIPPFNSKRVKELCPYIDVDALGPKDLHYAKIYLQILERIEGHGVPTAGVVERKSTSHILARTILRKMQEEGFITSTYMKEAEGDLRRYRVVDSAIMHAVLRRGEYLSFREIERTAGGVGQSDYDLDIQRYPQPWATYLSTSDCRLPIRVETMRELEAGIERDMMRYLFHDSLLLSSYAYPLGLCAVDTFVKVSSKLAGRISNLTALNLIKAAVDKSRAEGNSEPIRMVFGHLAGNQRGTFNRPQAS